MTTNAPPFDPLNCTRAEEDDMMRGYFAGLKGAKPAMATFAFDHGYRVGRNDRAGVADDDQRALAKVLARRYLEEGL